MKKSSIAAAVSLTSFFAFSLAVSAQTAIGSVSSVNQGISDLDSLIRNFTTSIVKSVGLLLMAVAMVVFFWGIVEYIIGARKGEPTKITLGNTFMKWSLVALFVMFSVYGIIRLAQRFAFQSQDISTIVIPNLNFQPGATNQPTSGSPMLGSGITPNTNGNPSMGTYTPNTNGNPGTGSYSPNTNGNPGTGSYSPNTNGNPGSSNQVGSLLSPSLIGQMFTSGINGLKNAFSTTGSGGSGSGSSQPSGSSQSPAGPPAGSLTPSQDAINADTAAAAQAADQAAQQAAQQSAANDTAVPN